MQLKVTEPLQLAKDKAKEALDTRLYEHITITSRFPEWKQTNKLQKYIALSAIDIKGKGNAKDKQDLTDVLAIFQWKDAQIATLDALYAQIDAASSHQGVRTIVASATFTAPPAGI